MSIATDLSGIYTALDGVLDDCNAAIAAKEGTAAASLSGIAAQIAALPASAGGEYDITATDNGDGTQDFAITDASGGGSGSGSGGASLNLAYGDTAPADTTKLWIKTAEPGAVTAKSVLTGGVESMGGSAGSCASTRAQVTAAAVGTDIYIFGGMAGTSAQRTDISKFDTLTGIRTTMSAAFQYGNYGSAAIPVGTKIYLMGGNREDIQIYDTVADTIVSSAAYMPYYNIGNPAMLCGDTIYCKVAGGGAGQIRAYNPLTDSNALIGTNTDYKINEAYATVGTCMYVFGGQYNGYYTNAIWKFDSQALTYTQLTAVLPDLDSDLTAAAVGTDIYIFGGYNAKTAIFKFDTLTETLITIAATTPAIAKTTAVAVGTDIYLIGGYNGSAYMSSILKFSVTFPVTQGDVVIQSDVSGNEFDLISENDMTVKCCVKNVFVGNADGNAQIAEAYLYKNNAWAQI